MEEGDDQGVTDETSWILLDMPTTTHYQKMTTEISNTESHLETYPHIFDSTAGFIHTFHKVFHETQLYVQRGQKTFSGRTRGGLTIFFSAGFSDVR